MDYRKRSRPPRRWVITRWFASGSSVAGVILLAVLLGIAWRATNVVWFLFFPVLLIGILAAAAVGVLWIVRHF